ncbi:MAG TPA: hypothetical protein DG761_10025 [Gammaproteobacteria bacterium]|jgi:hypothetical protein|nr:hypothetical protein [Gammaproteobacteria bacterium]|tara:strand:+ start:1337 stop:1792 length:456 start_codon:yes stop_codon:yes gene_type:complete
MNRLIASVIALLLCCSIVWAQSGRITITTARVGQNLLLTAEIPAAAVANSTSAANTRLQTLAIALRDVSQAFVLPEAAGCEQNAGDVIRHFGNAGSGSGISAGWEFICTDLDELKTVGISLFSLIPVESMDGLTFPDGQQVIFASNPVLKL